MIQRSLSQRLAMVVTASIGLMFALTGPAHAQSWKPALHDADELFDAAEDLHDRAEHFHDAPMIPVTARLEQLTAQLYGVLKHNACVEDVMSLYQTIGLALEEASAGVQLSCHLRVDRKSQSELANARRYYAATGEHLRCAVPRVSQRPTIRVQTAPPQLTAPWYAAPVRPAPGVVGPWHDQPEYRVHGYPDAGYAEPHRGIPPQQFAPPQLTPSRPEPQRPLPYGHEIHHRPLPQPESTGRTLARVILSELLAR